MRNDVPRIAYLCGAGVVDIIVSWLLLNEGWRYYRVLINWDLHKNTTRQVIEFHNKRGNGENVIREHKYAFDLKHFPCKKPSANEVYGLFALIAHNHLRTTALLDNKEQALYDK